MTMTDYASTPEPMPTGGTGPSIHDLVVRDVLARKAMGLRKYGVYLRIGDGRRTLVDAYQEALDLAVYLRQELAKQGTEPRWSTSRDIARLAIVMLMWFGLVVLGTIAAVKILG